ncbi:sensor histidine kinase N-terminal domain-containing protein [Luteolibacter yonseiensis]|uniref:histidine kinase n=1 Tax=Luteolibacter yonseiensis TaxID=1144680 RepID=A0A934VCA9_9BACT|nr:ATP-binding protein [Luteolibacter yonseiensis]MBK1816980.1 sensor histidine kinase N-terminal domain-containing protein [Luteolibacter yonseiensis]
MKSIRHQLTRQLVAGTLVIAGCGGAATYLTMRAAVLNQFDEALLGKARAISALTQQGRGGKPRLELDDVRSLGFTESGSEDFFQLRLLDGKSVARFPAFVSLPRPENSTDSPVFQNIELPGDIDGRAVSFAFTPDREDDDDNDGDEKRRRKPVAATIVVASSRHSLDTTLHMMLAALGMGTTVLLASAWIIVPRVLRRGMLPLDEFASRVSGINTDSLSTRLPETGTPSEIAPIARCLNDLLIRIGASFERERRFSADLAHELRTPLAELRSQAELSLKWPDTRAAGADADTLAIALRMEHLVTRLLALARAEGGHSGMVREKVPIQSAVLTAWRPFANQADAKGLRVTFNLPSDQTIESDPALLREILSNLFSNAVDYTPADGEVDVAGSPASSPFRLTVSNTVQDLDSKDVENMFDRFWRKEASRSDDEHAGLGLALARGYAQALGLDLGAGLDGPFRLTVTLKSMEK